MRAGLTQGDPDACCEVLRRLASSSTEVLGQCSILGCDPGVTVDRKIVVTVMELLREFDNEEPKATLFSFNVDQFLKPALYLKKKYGLIARFAKYVKKQIDRFALTLPHEDERQLKNDKKKTANLTEEFKKLKGVL